MGRLSARRMSMSEEKQEDEVADVKEGDVC